jgi:predicted aconitase with swiveling domain
MGAGDCAGREFRGHAGIGEQVSGVVLAAGDDFSARYDLDRIRGTFSRPSHALYGESYVGRILVLNTAKGGVATAWMLHEMCSRAMAPSALLLNRANPIMVQGAAFAGLPFIDRFEVDITRSLRTGDTVTVFPGEGLVRVDSSEDARGMDG